MTYELTGKVFGHLTVQKKLPNKDSRGKTLWQCLCACGNLKVYETYMLTGMKGARTCRECKDHIRHKDAYTSWTAARQRCRDSNRKDYKYYGASDITFSPEWDDFKMFLRDMGDPPIDFITGERMSLDRVDNNLGYFKENCKWSTRSEQQLNKGKQERGDLQS